MRTFRSSRLAILLSLIAMGLFVVPANVACVLAEEEAKVTTEITHKPIPYFVPEKRIGLKVRIMDKHGINRVRCYFRAAQKGDYFFVTMMPIFDFYEGILPAPSKETQTIEYLFLVVNGRNDVVKTQTFEVKKKDKDNIPAWQQISSKGHIRVITELAQPPMVPAGFTDAMAMEVAESYSRFGFVVEGLYTTTQEARAGGPIGIAAAADYGGTISAKTGGRSTLAYVGIGAALLAGGAAAAGGGGGGGGNGHPSTSTIPLTTTSTTSLSTTTVPTTTISPTTEPSTTTSTTSIPSTTSTTTLSTSIPSTTSTTTSSTTTIGTTTSTTTMPVTTTSTTTSTTTTLVSKTSTTSFAPCTENRPPQMISLTPYGYPNTTSLCVGDRMAFTASAYDPDTNSDIQRIHVRIVNTHTGEERAQDLTYQPGTASTHFTVSGITNYTIGFEQVRYCLYVSLLDRCGNWSSELAGCAYSRECSGHNQVP